MDSDKKTTTEDNSKIVLIKKKGKVKALDEELYSRSHDYLHPSHSCCPASVLCVVEVF